MLKARIDGDELVTQGELVVGDMYFGFCCEGHAWEVVMIPVSTNFGMVQLSDETKWQSVWGVCHNPECPVVDESFNERPEEDPYRGVTNHCFEDFVEQLAEAEGAR